MKLLYTLRLNTEHFSKIFTPQEGIKLSEIVTKVTIDSRDPRIMAIRQLDGELRKRKDIFYYSHSENRTYTKKELSEATVLHWEATKTLPLCGEQCGTKYDDDDTCNICWAGGSQVSPLRLEQIATGTSIATTIADEIVLSEEVKSLIENELTGLRFSPVTSSTKRSLPFFQLHPVSFCDAVSPTEFGISVFSEEEDQSACPAGPLGHVNGLNLLSEITIDRESWDGSDFVATRNFVGERRGLLRPKRLNLMSKKGFDLFSRLKIKGVRFSVARLAVSEPDILPVR
jgi:hypothetical protein